MTAIDDGATLEIPAEPALVAAVDDGPRRELQPVDAAPMAPETRERRLDRTAALAVTLVLLGVYLVTMGGHTYSSDGETYLAGTRALVHHTTVMSPGTDMDAIVSLVQQKNGGYTTAAGVGTLLLFAPGYIAGKAVSLAFPVAAREEVLRLVYLSANSLFTALTGGLLVLLCRALGARRRSAVLLALVFGLGTWAWPHSQTDFSEPGTMLMVTATMLASVHWWRSRSLRWPALVGLLAGFTVLTRASTMVFLPALFFAGFIGAKRPRPEKVRQAVAFAAGGVIPGVLFAVNAWLRFGSPFDNGYPPMKYATPVYEGMFGLIFSPGKGLLWYAPVCIVVLFGLRQSMLAHRRYTLTILAIFVLHATVYARFEVWSGENAYGPRYLVPLLAVFVALLAPIIDSGSQWLRGVRLAGVVGFLIPGLLGATMYFNAVYSYSELHLMADINVEATPTPTQQYLAWNFQPRSSPLILELRAVPKLFENSAARLRGEDGGITPMPVPYEERIHWYARAIEPDFWWVWWSAKDLPAGAYLLGLVPLACLVGAAGLGRKLRRTTRLSESA